MRTPRMDVLPRSERLRVMVLDVTTPESIAAALEASGPLDVLVELVEPGYVRPLALPPTPDRVRTA